MSANRHGEETRQRKRDTLQENISPTDSAHFMATSVLWLDAIRVNIIVVMNLECHHSCRYTPFL
ncbi:hypothetical protein L914_10314 [Phytophthora nicotianae]|uniref:Uncharacterized protein n=1 Tax=Phytophthora nicotianae TaxID=4792 RepID=W2N6Z8_PHYNI|nr:hypothetical protein L914_10314 [Phytophthora nicotianae]